MLPNNYSRFVVDAEMMRLACKKPSLPHKPEQSWRVLRFFGPNTERSDVLAVPFDIVDHNRVVARAEAGKLALLLVSHGDLLAARDAPHALAVAVAPRLAANEACQSLRVLACMTSQVPIAIAVAQRTAV